MTWLYKRRIDQPRPPAVIGGKLAQRHPSCVNRRLPAALGAHHQPVRALGETRPKPHHCDLASPQRRGLAQKIVTRRFHPVADPSAPRRGRLQQQAIGPFRGKRDQGYVKRAGSAAAIDMIRQDRVASNKRKAKPCKHAFHNISFQRVISNADSLRLVT